MNGERYGLPVAIFALKVLIAGLLALYITMRIGLERPYWAFLTTFIVAQPLAGAVLSKALYRVVGTMFGAAAAVIMVPALVNSPELLTLALGLWLGLCVFVSLLDRTPRSYIFVLAGYSACIIAIPSVGEPADIFNTAVLRVQEIFVGIACGSLVHGFILPGSVTGLLFQRIDVILRDAERWSRDAIAPEVVEGVEQERRRLANDVTELHQLSTHLPFETSRLAPRVVTVRALQDQLSLLLPLGAAVDDRMQSLRSENHKLPDSVIELIDDVRAWLAESDNRYTDRGAAANALIARCAELEPGDASDLTWTDMMQLSLMVRLATLIAAHRDCRDLRDQMETHSRQPITPRIAELLDRRRGRELHRDYGGALRGGAGAFITLVVGSAFWIASGSYEFGGAVLLGGVFLALLSAMDNPILPLRGFMVGTMISSLIGLIYGYVIMPRVDGYVMLAAVMAPILLIGGSLMSSPRYGVIALASMLGLGSPVLLSSHFLNQFPVYVNGQIAMLVGVWFAILMVRLLHSAGAEAAIRRTIRAGWTDIATRSTQRGPPDVRAWINRMLDRVALLGPRLAARGEDQGKPFHDALRDLRTGVAVGELLQLRIDLPDEVGNFLTPVLTDVAAYYRGLNPDAPAQAGPSLLAHIDAAMDRLTRDELARRPAMIALVSLRRNLFPTAPGYQRMIA